jgi:hypothetical protein
MNRPTRIVNAAVRGLSTAVSAVADWAMDMEGWVSQVEKHWRLATRQATGEELVYWAAGELGELGEVYLKNLLLGEMRQRREAEADAVKLITELRDGDAGSVDRQEVAELLAKFREELDGESR